MLFNSYQFLIFLPIVVLFYFLIPHRFRHVWLLLASYFFYACWNPSYTLLLLFSTTVTYFSSRLIANASTTSRKKLFVALSLVLNFATLFFFKYFNFAVENLERFFGFKVPGAPFDIVLPVGISFYIFQAIGYTIDIYRNELPPEKNFLRYALFVSFFPQLVAGPIERSKHLLGQFYEKHYFDFNRAKDGFLLILWGMFQKIVIADRLGILVRQIFDHPSEYQGLYIIFGVICFAFQIYCDFSGYSLIAIGSAKIMGFRLMENFDAPYFSRSIPEFWRRWHISLSSWFRDYLYIPLGGNRKGKLRTYLNLMLVFLASGLWHGASWHFIVWGGLHGLFIVLSRITKNFREKLRKRSPLPFALHVAFRLLVTFTLVNFAWLFFRAESLNQAFLMLGNIFRSWNPQILFDGSLAHLGLSSKSLFIGLIAVAILLIADCIKWRGTTVRSIIYRRPIWFRWLFYLIAIFTILVFGVWGPTYNQSNFIYFQF